MKKLIIAGGGTGGHIYSGLAVAEEWKARGGEVLFVGTARGMEKDLVPRNGYPLELIQVSPLKGAGFVQRLKALAALPRALLQSLQILRRVKPQAVLGIGGYASGPMGLMAKILGIPTSVIDQNSVPGMTNRYLGAWVDRVFLTFEGSESYFRKPEKVRLFGNPVIRKRHPQRAREVHEEKVILICGGSQGAHAVNELVAGALAAIQKEVPSLRVIHQTGPQDVAWVKSEFEKKGIRGQVEPFINDMDAVYAQADLVIARSGAGTLTELALWGLPSILIPFPFAADDHQKKNAEAFVKKEAAFVLIQSEATSEQLAQKAISLLKDPTKLEKMAHGAKQLARPDAAKRIVDEMEGLMRV